MGYLTGARVTWCFSTCLFLGSYLCLNCLKTCHVAVACKKKLVCGEVDIIKLISLSCSLLVLGDKEESVEECGKGVESPCFNYQCSIHNEIPVSVRCHLVCNFIYS